MKSSVENTVQLITTEAPAERLASRTDSLSHAFHKIDSIRRAFNLAADSIQGEYQAAISMVNGELSRVNRVLDSLHATGTSKGGNIRMLDSLRAMHHTEVLRFTSRVDALKTRTAEDLNSLDLPPEYREPLNEVTTKLNDL